MILAELVCRRCKKEMGLLKLDIGFLQPDQDVIIKEYCSKCRKYYEKKEIEK